MGKRLNNANAWSNPEMAYGVNNRPTPQSSTPSPERCTTWGYYTGRQCSEAKGHDGRHITEPAVGRYSRADSPSPEGAEPRTEAGRVLLRVMDGYDWPKESVDYIVAIEREAALPEPPLDVERAARFFHDEYWSETHEPHWPRDEAESTDCSVCWRSADRLVSWLASEKGTDRGS